MTDSNERPVPGDTYYSISLSRFGPTRDLVVREAKWTTASGFYWNGKEWLQGPQGALMFETREEAESEAVLVVTRFPEYIGGLEVRELKVAEWGWENLTVNVVRRS